MTPVAVPELVPELTFDESALVPVDPLPVGLVLELVPVEEVAAPGFALATAAGVVPCEVAVLFPPPMTPKPKSRAKASIARAIKPARTQQHGLQKILLLGSTSGPNFLVF